jgi:peptide/nickel transport system permease protein
MASLIFVIIMILAVVFAPLITKYNYSDQNLRETFQGPSAKHWLGTDNMGRDTFSRMLYGGRISLLLAFCSIIVTLIVSLPLGAILGYYGGTFDAVVTRILDIIMALPSILLCITISAALGPGLINTAIAMSVGSLPHFARQVRASILTLRGNEYVDAARSFGAKGPRIILRHIIPNSLAPLIVQVSMKLSQNILTISSMSFIGLGVQPPTPEWGSILNAGRAYVDTFPQMMLWPGLMIGLSMLCFSLLGDGLRDAMDPRLKD